MSQLEKLISKMQSVPPPKDIQFLDFKKYLEHYGYELVRTNGSHNIFRNQILNHELCVPVVSGKTVKPIYIKEANQVIRQLEEK